MATNEVNGFYVDGQLVGSVKRMALAFTEESQGKTTLMVETAYTAGGLEHVSHAIFNIPVEILGALGAGVSRYRDGLGGITLGKTSQTFTLLPMQSQGG